ncbi:MAG: putative zinc-binding metallopeptidase [Phycisphaeraceae bacterium]|nr:putative zinc-binding metallopeptidase [Phycisphaeraceae bacterium]
MAYTVGAMPNRRTNPASPARPRPRARRREPEWAEATTAELLRYRLCDLKLKVEGSAVEPMVERLHEELAERGIQLRPQVWFSSEWFAPDGIPGIAIPFYLAHPRLMRLEKRMMFQVEGGTRDQCLAILRHEAGHAVDNAFRLHRRKIWRQTFGSFRVKYPDFYQPRPTSRDYVLHLPGWYAQAHPAEDFAETFAVWLTPRSRWKSRYAGWGAMRKLLVVDELMASIAHTRPPVLTRKRVEPLADIRMTLARYYEERRSRYVDGRPEFYDRDLLHVFSEPKAHNRSITAVQFLRRHRASIREIVSHWTNLHPYTIDQLLGDLIDRCQQLKLRAVGPTHRLKTETMMMLTVQTLNFTRGRRRWIPV